MFTLDLSHLVNWRIQIAHNPLCTTEVDFFQYNFHTLKTVDDIIIILKHTV